MRAAAYARFSSDLQRETSLEDQLRECREAADRNGWTWQETHVYTDAAISGASLEGRAGLQALLAAANTRPRPFDVMLVDDSSRIARDLADALRVLQQLKFAGVRVLYISQGIDSANEQAETLIAVHGLIDGLYLREMAAKIRRGLAGQLARGFHTGSVLYGYRTEDVLDPSGRIDGNGHIARIGRRLIVQDDEATIVRQIFEWYAAGIGVPTIVEKLSVAGVRGPRGKTWKFGAVRRMLENERFTGKQIWGQSRYERRPGSRLKVARPQPRSEWRILEQPELRIVSDELWAAVQARIAVVAAIAPRQPGTNLQRGGNASLHSRHLFSGFMRCALCGGAITVVTGGYGTPRYGCQRASKNGSTACTNRLTIRAKIADAALLEGLQAELLRPETLDYVTSRLTSALEELRAQRPAQRDELERAIAAADQKLRHLVAAVEAGAGAAMVFEAIQQREADLRALTQQREALDDPLEQRIAVIPSWVRQQLADAADVLRDVPERAKTEFQRFGLQFTIVPVHQAGARSFLRAEGSGEFERLAFRQSTDLRLSPKGGYGSDRVSASVGGARFASVFASFSEQTPEGSTADRSLLRLTP